MADDLAHVLPPLDPVSSTLTPPPALRTKPRLEDFEYRTKQFPAVPPLITASSCELDVTISLVSTMLDGNNNDMALNFMIDHKVLLPDLSPASSAQCHPAKLTAPERSASVLPASGGKAWRGNAGRPSNRTTTGGHGDGLPPARPGRGSEAVFGLQ